MNTLWKYAIKGARSVTQRSPILSADQVIATFNHGQGSNFQGSIVSLCPDTGSENWRFDRPHFFTQPVFADDGAILTTGFDGVAHRIGPDGRSIWASPVTERNLWAGALHSERFVFSEIGGLSEFTWAVDARTGEVVWRYRDGGHSYGVVFDRAGSVFITSAAHNFDASSYSLHGVDVETGQANWQTAHSEILFRPVVLDDLIVVGSRGAIAAFDCADGSLVSRLKIGSGSDFNQNLIRQGDTVFTASNQGHVVALSLQATRGIFGRAKRALKPAWEAHLGSPVQFFAFARGSLACLTQSGDLCIVDPDDGSLLARTKLARFEEGMGLAAIGDHGFIAAVDRHCARIEP